MFYDKNFLNKEINPYEEIEKEILKEYQKIRFYTAIMEYINKIETELKQEKE